MESTVSPAQNGRDFYSKKPTKPKRIAGSSRKTPARPGVDHAVQDDKSPARAHAETPGKLRWELHDNDDGHMMEDALSPTAAQALLSSDSVIDNPDGGEGGALYSSEALHHRSEGERHVAKHEQLTPRVADGINTTTRTRYA